MPKYLGYKNEEKMLALQEDQPQEYTRLFREKKFFFRRHFDSLAFVKNGKLIDRSILQSPHAFLPPYASQSSYFEREHIL